MRQLQTKQYMQCVHDRVCMNPTPHSAVFLTKCVQGVCANPGGSYGPKCIFAQPCRNGASEGQESCPDSQPAK